jgi:hypothetical protein
MRRSPAQNGPIGVDILSKTSGLALRSGVQSQPDTKKTATSFLAVIHIAAAADWIKP